MPAIDAIGYDSPGTVKAMVLFNILSPLSNCHAIDWWSGSYARIIYPKADLTSRRTRRLLDGIGEEEALSGFFGGYLRRIPGG